MRDVSEFTALSIDDAGNLTLTIDSWGLWEALPDSDKEVVIEDSAHWYIIQKALDYELGERLSTPNFNSSIYKLREMIVTNPAFVNDITVTFIKQLLEELAKAKQYQRKAEQAFWKLYHATLPHRNTTVVCPSDINRGDRYLHVSTKEVRQEIMEHFRELLKEEGVADNE